MRSDRRAVLEWCGLGLVFTSAIVLGVTSSSADQVKLTPDQAEARATFEKGLESSLREVEEKCGAPIVVTTDFENYKDKLESGNNRPISAKTICLNVLNGIASSCAATARLAASGKPPPKNSTAAKVTAVSCLYAGSQPKEPSDRWEDYVQRNLSFSNGVLTIRMRGDLPNIDQTVFDILRGQTVEKTQPLTLGAKCTKGGNCRTGLCSRNVCTACTSSAVCGAGHFCSSGTCYADDEPRDSPSGSSSTSTPTKRGKGLGAMCKSTSECETGRTCKVKTSKLSTCQ